jgi:hypothetical protein
MREAVMNIIYHVETKLNVIIDKSAIVNGKIISVAYFENLNM